MKPTPDLMAIYSNENFHMTPQEIISSFPAAFQPGGEIERLLKEYGTLREDRYAEAILADLLLKDTPNNEELQLELRLEKLTLVEELVKLNKHLNRLKRLKSLASGKQPGPGIITEEMIQQAKAVPCQELLPEKQFRQAGKRSWTHCPFHDDKNPSFEINLETNKWKCWSFCGSGDSIDLCMKLNQCSFAEAVKALGGG